MHFILWIKKKQIYPHSAAFSILFFQAEINDQTKTSNFLKIFLQIFTAMCVSEKIIE